MTEATDIPIHDNIHKMLSLELHHVSKDTMDAIKRNDYFGLIFRAVEEDGWLIATYVPGEMEFAVAMPDDLKKLIEIARAHDCAFLMLERNGETHPKIPLFAW